MYEKYEWIHSWVDCANDINLPRVLLVGDSITYGYQEIVRKKMRGKAYIDYLATSYAVDIPIYSDLIKLFVNDRHYDIIHFNHGLHGIHLEKEEYRQRMSNCLKNIAQKGKIALATCTIVFCEGNEELHPQWNIRVEERNAAIFEIAEKKNFSLDDLYSVSLAVPKEYRRKDGTHYKRKGCEMLAAAVVSFLENMLTEAE